MSDAFYTSLRDGTAGPLIEKYGMALTLRRTTPGTYNPATGGRGTATTADYACFGVLESYNAYMVANSLVQQGDKKLLLSAKNLAVTPQIGDQFIMSDGTWFIAGAQQSLVSAFQPIQALAPGGITVMYTIQIRK